MATWLGPTLWQLQYVADTINDFHCAIVGHADMDDYADDADYDCDYDYDYALQFNKFSLAQFAEQSKQQQPQQSPCL